VGALSSYTGSTEPTATTVIETTEIPTSSPTLSPIDTPMPSDIPVLTDPRLPSHILDPTDALIPPEAPNSTEISISPDAPGLSDYQLELITIRLFCEKYLYQLSERSSEASSDPLLLFDENWRTRITESLAGKQLSGDQLISVREVPSSFIEIDTLLVRAGDEALMVVEDFSFGIKNLDFDSLSSLVDHLGQYNE